MRHPWWSSQPARDRAHAGIAHATGVLGKFARRACWANTFYNEVIMRCHMGSLVAAVRKRIGQIRPAFWANTACTTAFWANTACAPALWADAFDNEDNWPLCITCRSIIDSNVFITKPIRVRCYPSSPLPLASLARLRSRDRASRGARHPACTPPHPRATRRCLCCRSRRSSLRDDTARSRS